MASRAARYVRRGTKTSRTQLIQVDAMAYGAVREYVSGVVQNVVPVGVLGNIGDEVAMGVLNYFVAKNTSGMLRDVAAKGLVIENARLGQALTQGFIGGSPTSSSGLLG